MIKKLLFAVVLLVLVASLAIAEDFPKWKYSQAIHF